MPIVPTKKFGGIKYEKQKSRFKRKGMGLVKLLMADCESTGDIQANKIYPVVFFEGIVFNSRKDSKIISKCVYSVLGINMEGQKEILGTWISENESASFYASICSDLRNRGVA